MSADWTDEAFLGYCVLHCETPRALFSRAQVDRLQALAGNDPIPWDGTYPAWCGLGPETILPVVARARERLASLTPDKSHDTEQP